MRFSSLSQNAYFSKLSCIGGVATILVLSCSQVTAAGVLPANVLTAYLTGGGSLGLLILDQSNGAVSFCSAMSYSGVPPQPVGQCVLAGNVGLSAAGFILNGANSNAIIINKTNGIVFECTSENQASGTAAATCAKIGYIP
jgi:hypothetical protein